MDIGDERYLPLDAAARQLAVNPDELSAEQWQALFSGIRGYIGHSFPSLAGPEECEDLAATVVETILRSSRAGRLDPAQKPGAYVLRAARNAAVDRVRRRATAAQHETALPASLLECVASGGSELTDDHVARKLDGAANAAAIRAALSRAKDVGDATTVRVIASLLDGIAETGVAPSNRQLAGIVGVSHTGVAKCLLRFRDHLHWAGFDGQL